MITIATLLFSAEQMGRVVAGVHSAWPYLSRYGLLTAVGGFGLIALAVGARWAQADRRRLTIGRITFDATVLTLFGMATLYDHALAASRVSIWAAVIVLVAVAWDVGMSGESRTNRGSRHFPRATRLLAFLGYILLLASTVLFYSAQRAAVGGHTTPVTRARWAW